MGEENKLSEKYKAIIQTYLDKKDEELRDKAIRIYYELQDCKEVRNKKMHRWARYMLERFFSLTEDDIKEIWLGSLEKKHIPKQAGNANKNYTLPLVKISCKIVPRIRGKKWKQRFTQNSSLSGRN